MDVFVVSVKHKWDDEYELLCVCATKTRMEQEQERYLKQKEQLCFPRDEFTFTHTAMPLLED